MNLFFRPFIVALSILGFSHSFSNARDGDAPAAKISESWKDHPVVIRVESGDCPDG